MLVFALMLMAGGLIVAVALIVFLADNLLGLLCGICAAQVALVTGGGWPGAVGVAALTFAVTTAGLRIAIFTAPSRPLRLCLASLVVAPATVAAFLLAEGLLWPFVPAPAWRTVLALFAAAAGAAGACRRLWALRPAA